MGLLIPIDDGYTLDGTVAAKRPWPAVKFKFRPPTPEESLGYFAADKSTGAKWLTAMVGLLVNKLAAWDVTDAVKDKEGALREDLVPISEAVLRRVPEPMLSRILNVVLAAGQEMPDEAKN